MLRVGGTHHGMRLLSADTVATMTRAARTGLIDPVYGGRVDWGLGPALDLFAFGRHCSPATFGHVGGTCVSAFADPVHEVSAAIFLNGHAPGEAAVTLLHAVASAIYVAVGVAQPDAPGRTHPAPAVGVL
jgi:CubicO group peptidase (beta-lactamase class C family)